MALTTVLLLLIGLLSFSNVVSQPVESVDSTTSSVTNEVTEKSESVQPEHPANHIRSALDNLTSSETSVYVCQNFDWFQPCRLLPLYAENNGQQDFWMAPAPGGPGPFGTGNYTIGSWGPSSGVTTFWVDDHGNTSDPMTFPGTGNVDQYWSVNVWTWFPYWNQTS